MKKNIFLSILFFAAGFLTHAWLFPDALTNSLSDIQEITAPDISPTAGAAQGEQGFMNRIDFDGERFNKHKLAMEVGSYIVITNINKENQLMSLSSNNPLLSTPRGYGESEAIRVRLDTRGEYVVTNKNNPEEKLMVSVK